MPILMYLPVAAIYLGLAAWAWRAASGGLLASAAVAAAGGVPPLPGMGALPGAASSGELPTSQRLLLLLAWLAHGTLLFGAMFGAAGLRFGFAFALSAAMWLAVAIYWVESLYFSLASMRLLILPLAAVCAVLPAWFPGSVTPNPVDSLAFDLHLAVAISASGLLTIAALHACLMAALDRWLHGRDATGEDGRLSWLDRLRHAVLSQLPPLLTMERLLFRTIGAGFVLLTLTVLSGALFSEELFGRPLRLEHKTVFGLLSWAIFAAVLIGRTTRGWRGRVALRWTLAGFVSILLAYVGSRFVLEVILHRV